MKRKYTFTMNFMVSVCMGGGLFLSKISPQVGAASLTAIGSVLASRLVLFTFFQAIIAGIFALNGQAGAWRPRLLPYLVIFHGLLDLGTVWFVFAASLGIG